MVEVGGGRIIKKKKKGEELGELEVKKSPGETVNTVEGKLITDLAAQSGHVLLIFSLTADLQARLFFCSSRRRHTSSLRDWSSDVCSSDLAHSKAEGETAAKAEAAGEVPAM